MRQLNGRASLNDSAWLSQLNRAARIDARFGDRAARAIPQGGWTVVPLFVTKTRPAVQPPGTGFSAAETGPRKRAHCIGGDQKTEIGAKKARQRRADLASLHKSADGLCAWWARQGSNL